MKLANGFIIYLTTTHEALLYDNFPTLSLVRANTSPAPNSELLSAPFISSTIRSKQRLVVIHL